MSYPVFVSALFVLLLSPGPTNTLMGLAAARHGFWRVPKLLPAELLGYLTIILPLAWLGEALITRWSDAVPVLKSAAAAWVMYLAVTLWVGRKKEIGHQQILTARRVYVTTALNPKALVIGLVLLPQMTAPDFLPKLAIVAIVACTVAVIWGAVGTLAQVGAKKQKRLLLFQRAASFWLAIVSCTLIADLFRV
ncbi:LysE family translocator [Agrobacterium salinitolerans]